MGLAKWMQAAGVALALAAPVVAQAAEGATSPLDAPRSRSEQPRPKIEVDEIEKNVGEVPPGQNAVFSFAIRNTGQMPLEIRKVKGDCGCIVAEFDREIAPGASGTVRATINTRGRKGDLTKHLRVESNDPQRPALSLTMRARVFEPISIFPSDLILMPLTPNRMAAVDVVVRCNETAPLQIQKISCTHPGLRVRLLPVAGGGTLPGTEGSGKQPDQRLELMVPRSAKPESFDALVTLHVNRPDTPILFLRVSGYPSNAVAVNPPRLYFGEIMGSDPLPIKRTLTLFRREGPFRVLSATAEDPALELTVEPGEEGNYCDVRVAYKGGWKRGDIEGSITLRTSDPARPVIEVPYAALMAE